MPSYAASDEAHEVSVFMDDQDDRDALRRWLREVLSATAWSGAELARRAGVSASTVNRFINSDEGTTIGTRSLLKIQKVVAAKLGNVPHLEHLTGAGGESALGLTEDRTLFASTIARKTTVVDVEGSEFAAIPRYDAAMSAGPGSIIDPQAEPIGHHLIEAQWLRSVTRSSPSRLAVLRVDGDSMEDTLRDGDWVLIDRGETRANRNGVFALQVGDATWVKRLTLNLRDELIQVISDNPRYPVQELPEDQLTVIGRIVWIVARKL